MKITDHFDLDNTLVDIDASIVEFAKRFKQHFSTELAVSCVNEITQIIQAKDSEGHLAKDQAVSRELYEQLQWDRYVKIGYLEHFWKLHFPASIVPMQVASN